MPSEPRSPRRPTLGLLALLALLGVMLLPGPPAGAQETGTLFLFHRDGAVELRWNAPRDPSAAGFHVERRPAGGAWDRLTTEPVRRVEDVARIRDLLGSRTDAFLAFFPNRERIDAAAFARVMEDSVAASLIGLLSVKMPQLGTVLGERYSDSALVPGESFDYRVLRLDPGGEERIWATAGPVVHGEHDRVPVPEELAGEGGDGTAALAWSHDPWLSRSGRLVGYRVYRAEQPYGPFEPAAAETVVPARVGGELPEDLFVDRFLVNGVPTWYRITGVNVVGAESEPTVPVRVVPRDLTPPPPPEHVDGRPLGQAVVLTWQPVPAADLEGYAVDRGRQLEGPYERLTPAAGDPPSPGNLFVDDDVAEGGIYWYRVSALDSSGNESRPSPTVQVYLEDRTPPAAPGGVAAEAGDEGIRITWERSADADLLGWVVERTTRLSGAERAPTAEGPFYALHAEPLSEPAYLDAVPTASESRYAYRVVALDGSWNRSAASEVVVARMPDRVPPAPPALHGARLEGDRVVLRWGRSGEDDLAGYRVERAAGPGRPFQAAHPHLLPREATTFEDRPGPAGATLLYRLVAVDRDGNESDTLAPVFVRLLDLVPPDPPAGLDVESLDGALVLTWRPAADDVTALLVYRRASGQAQPRLRARLERGTVRWEDRDVEPGNEYTYHLRAVDAAANVSPPGDPVTAVHEPPAER